MSTTFEQAQSLVASLARQERARLFVWMAADIADQLPGIEFDPRVCGGAARIARISHSCLVAGVMAQARNTRRRNPP